LNPRLLKTVLTHALVATLLLMPTPGSALATEDTSVRHFPAAIVDDIVALPTMYNAWWLIGGTALTIGVYQFEDAEGASRALDQGIWDTLSDVGNIWGDPLVQVPLALGTWGVGNWTDNESLAGLGFDLSRGLLLSTSVTGLLKPIADRTRPNGDSYSFPSGHAAAAFTTAGVVCQRYGGWAGGISLGLGVMTAMGRMEDLKHYPSDVIAGATIGWIIGWTVGRDKSGEDTALRIVPTGNGLALTGQF
jgi:membrane-associated phospholipid phosphatase